MKRTALFGLLALVSCAALADGESTGFRAGIGVSFGQFKGEDVPAPELSDRFIHDNATGFKAYGQYQFNDWLAVEGAYHYTNDFDDKSKSPSLPGKLEINFGGFSAQALLYIPNSIEGFKAYVKGGFYDFDDDLALNGANIDSASERGLVAGAGFILDIGDNIGVRFDYDWFDADVGDLSSVNVSLEYSFGGAGQSGDAGDGG